MTDSSEYIMLTDHKPLVQLVNAKDLDRTPLKRQRLLKRIEYYKANTAYARGMDLAVADAM